MSLPGAWNQCILHFRDAQGRQTRCFWSLADQTDAIPEEVEEIAIAAQLASDAHLFAVQWQTTKQYPTPVIGAGAYRTCRDVVALLGQVNAPRSYPRYLIPAPKETLLMPDHFVVDMSSLAYLDLEEAMVGVVGFEDDPLVAIKRGWRDMK